MKITIQSTTTIVEIQSAHGRVPARLWEGTTEDGVPVHCFITRIAPSIPRERLTAEDVAEFERSLGDAHMEPSPDLRAIPLRYFID